ncbi:MAG: outer rane autotransporter barrel domain protein, partial [Bacteroidetes bacterium]|nr:outer rane autotransporter barrel domain protein [Bacteroidota bacterium]
VGGDTAYIVAILRKGSTVVAEAKFLHPDNDAGFVYFEAPFTYYNCIEPDTLVYTVSSGNPYGISGVITGGSTGLHVGSALNVDSIFLIDTLVGFSVPPFVLDDTASTLKNTPVTVPVTVNDNSCSGGALAVSVFAQPLHGTAVVSLNSITYTPNTGYVGLDTFYYTATVGGSPASPPAAGRMKVLAPAGVLDITEGQTKVYPNPAKDKLYITTTNPAVANVSVYDVLGNLVSANAISSNLTIDLSGVTEGVYLIRFTGNEGKVISSSRFSVVK